MGRSGSSCARAGGGSWPQRRARHIRGARQVGGQVAVTHVRYPVTEFVSGASARDAMYNVNNTVTGITSSNIGPGIDPPCPPVRQLPWVRNSLTGFVMCLVQNVSKPVTELGS